MSLPYAMVYDIGHRNARVHPSTVRHLTLNRLHSPSLKPTYNGKIPAWSSKWLICIHIASHGINKIILESWFQEGKRRFTKGNICPREKYEADPVHNSERAEPK